MRVLDGEIETVRSPSPYMLVEVLKNDRPTGWLYHNLEQAIEKYGEKAREWNEEAGGFDTYTLVPVSPEIQWGPGSRTYHRPLPGATPITLRRMS